MTTTAGIDVGSGAVKCVVMRTGEGGDQILGSAFARIRRRTLRAVVDEVFARALADCGVEELDYVATTGEGEDIPLATGHFYGMTTHARGALYLDPSARAVLDIGALHARAVAMDHRGKVLNYKMTSQCASGSGQFLENIARYLGVSLAEVGALSLSADKPEKVSSICAVLAETDVINMVSRGIPTQDILRGIHESMAFRFARLLRAIKAEDVVFVSGGIAADSGLIGALGDALKRDQKKRGRPEVRLSTHEMSIHAGAIGAAIWGGFRHRKLSMEAAVWKASREISLYAP